MTDEKPRKLQDYEKILLLLYLPDSQTDQYNQEAVFRRILGWSKERFTSAMGECVKRGFASPQPPQNPTPPDNQPTEQ